MGERNSRLVRPAEVLERQVALVKWWRGPNGVLFGDHFLRLNYHIPLFSGLYSQDWDGAYFAEREAHGLDRADTFWLSDDMKQVVQKVAPAMPPEVLREVDLPSRSGFVWFEKPVMLREGVLGADKAVRVAAVLWMPVRLTSVGAAYPTTVEGVQLSLYADDGQYLESEDLRLLRTDVTLFHTIPWAFGTSFLDHPDDEIEFTQGDFATLSVEWRRFMAAFWRLTQQKITSTTHYRADRSTRRRMERTGGLVLNQDTVRVVTLRKVAHRDVDPEYAPTTVEWSHRWLVDAYWATRHTKEGPRPTLISPHIKGPDDKPLVLKDKVYKVVR